ncbi:MAG: response regulator [Sporocytophaga sp.]|jgi:two-component system response regulator AtoC|nr:response regulator [Sporocytophaga sp.]
MEEIKINITLVEDNELYALFLEHKIKDLLNCNFKIYNNSEELINNLEFEKNTDIFILDYNLPGLKGLDTLRILRDRLPDAEIIILSNQSDIQVAIDLIKSGAFDYVIKNNDSVERILNAISKAQEFRFLRSENITLKLKINKYKSVSTIVAIIFFIFFTIILFLR